MLGIKSSKQKNRKARNEYEPVRRDKSDEGGRNMLTQKDVCGILTAIKGVPKECVDCAAFHQEGRISVPCSGDFDPYNCENSTVPDLPEEE